MSLRHNYIASRVHGLSETDAENFFNQYLHCLGNWYNHQLAISCASKEIDPSPRALHFHTELELKNLLDCNWRKKHLTPEQSKAVRAAFDGNRNSQFQPWAGLRMSGFGITNHMRFLKINFSYEEFVRTTLASILQLPVDQITCGGIPHPIIKPPGKGANLPIHVDGGVPLATLLEWTRTSPDADSWARDHGVQTLFHFRGATMNDKSGHTMGLDHLTVDRYMVLLEMLNPIHIHPHSPVIPFSTITDSAGPIFLEIFDLVSKKNQRKPSIGQQFLTALNQVLNHIEHGLPDSWVNTLPENLQTEMYSRCAIPLPPLEAGRICPTDSVGPYLAVWLLGFPHGATPAGDRSRVTINMDLDLITNDSVHPQRSANRTRGCKRAREIITGTLPENERKTKPFEGGIVHKGTETEPLIFPHFQEMAADPADILTFSEKFDQLEK